MYIINGCFQIRAEHKIYDTGDSIYYKRTKKKNGEIHVKS